MLRVVKGIDDALELRDWFAHQEVVALDTETSGFDPYDPAFAVRTIQFGNTHEAWVVPFAQWVGFVAELINRFDGTLLIHNSSYDIKALARHDVTVPWHKVDDTYIAMRLVEPHRQAGLKEAATRHISKAASDSQKDLHTAMRRNKWTWADIPLDFPPYIFYAAMDVILTARLYETKVCQAGLHAPLYGLEMDVRKLCSRMEHNGMRVDLDHCRTALGVLRDEAQFIRQELDSDYGINIGSNPILAKWLIEQGAPLTMLTDGGSPSVSREALEITRPLVEGRVAAVIDSVLRVRKIEKLASTYLENFITGSQGGVLHPSINTIQAKTGRMSMNSPSLHNLPRADEHDPDGTLVRSAIVPRSDTEVLVSCDYNQIELRCIATYSGDSDLQAAFHTSDAIKGDFFTEATRVVYADPSITKSDRRRSGVKSLFYASSYGAGLAKMARTAGMPLEEMRSISEAVFSRYPGVKALMKSLERKSKENDNWIVTPAGRRIWVDPEFSYKALNAFIQGHANDVFKQALVHMGNAGLEDLLVVPVHDEALLSVEKDDVPEVQHLVKECMTDMTPAVPLLADPSEGALTWGAIEK